MSSVLDSRPRGGLRTASTLSFSEMHALLGAQYPRRAAYERRRDERFPFPRLLRLTPIAANSSSVVGPSLVGCGKMLSQGGIGFFHYAPLPYRRVIVTMERDEQAETSLVVDLTWCRFTKLGWYESGGRFLEIVESPLATNPR